MNRYKTMWMTWNMKLECYVKFFARDGVQAATIVDEAQQPIRGFLRAVEVMGDAGYWYVGEIEVDPGENQIYMFQAEYHD